MFILTNKDEGLPVLGLPLDGTRVCEELKVVQEHSANPQNST